MVSSNYFFNMDITTIGNLFTSGGWGLVLFAVAIYAVRFIYAKLSAKLTEMDNSIKQLNQTVTELKVESSKFKTAIMLCDSPNCKAKKILEDKQ